MHRLIYPIITYNSLKRNNIYGNTSKLNCNKKKTLKTIEQRMFSGIQRLFCVFIR